MYAGLLYMGLLIDAYSNAQFLELVLGMGVRRVRK